MNMLDRLVGRLRRTSTGSERLPEHEALYPSRPMTSFLDALSPEQNAKLRAYRGQESHGESIATPGR